MDSKVFLRLEKYLDFLVEHAIKDYMRQKDTEIQEKLLENFELRRRQPKSKKTKRS